MDAPGWVRIEYWNHMTASWETGHAGLRLMNPTTYIQKLAKNEVIARAVDLETGEIVYGEGADLL